LLAEEEEKQNMISQRAAAIAFCLLISGISCLALVSCGGPPDGYLATDPTSVSFVQLTENNDQLSGHIQVVEKSNNTPPKVQSYVVPFTGTQNSQEITLNLTAFGLTWSSLTGSLNGNTLALQVPQQDGHLLNVTFNAASTDQYNQAVDALQQQVATATTQYNNAQATQTAQQATATAIAQEQQAVNDANSQLQSALSALKSDTATLAGFSESNTLSSYAKDWQQMQNDYAHEQQDAQNGCGEGNYNYGTVQYDAGTVDYDFGSIQYDDGSLNYDKNTYMSELTSVQNDVQAVQQDWTQLQQAVQNNPSGTPAPEFTANDVNGVLQNAQHAENQAVNTWKSASQAAGQYDQEAAALKQNADALPASMHCS
jgi:hypothetical protein